MSPYKDKEKQKQVNKERMKRVRGNTEKVTHITVTQEGNTSQIKEILGPYLCSEIESAHNYFIGLGLHCSLEERYQKAYSYHLSRQYPYSLLGAGS